VPPGLQVSLSLALQGQQVALVLLRLYQALQAQQALQDLPVHKVQALHTKALLQQFCYCLQQEMPLVTHTLLLVTITFIFGMVLLGLTTAQLQQVLLGQLELQALQELQEYQ
jgi:hypothetical protein